MGKLIEERGSRHDENLRLKSALCTKESNLNQLNAEAKVAATDTRKLQATIDSMRQTKEPILKENSDLKEWKRDAAQQIVDLTVWKEQAQLLINQYKKEKLASDVLAQMVVDLEKKLERYRRKYQASTKALAVMEETLRTVATHRKMLVEKKPSADKDLCNGHLNKP